MLASRSHRILASTALALVLAIPLASMAKAPNKLAATSGERCAGGRHRHCGKSCGVKPGTRDRAGRSG